MNAAGPLSKKLVVFLSLSACALLYCWLLFYVPRTSFVVTFGIFIVLFCLSYYLIAIQTILPLTGLLTVGAGFRLIALFSIPHLTDDYFRFIWDGQMSLRHINPFQYTPAQYMSTHADTYLQHLYSHMNSQEYNSIYPPLMQYIFLLAVWVFPGNVAGSIIVMKLFIVVSELFTILLLYKLVKKNLVHGKHMLWYALNPLVIVELTGNVHFEAMMICAIVFFLYGLYSKQWTLAACCWALAVITKWIPLILLPLLLRYLPFKIFMRFIIIAMGLVLLSFLPFLQPGSFSGMASSFRLFYHLFEFNAGLFYLIRQIGYLFVDYDIIEETAPILGIISGILIVLVSWWPAKKYAFAKKCLWVFCIYFAFSTMMHPWYCSILVAVAVFSRYRFPIVFSLLVLLSYYPYSLSVYNENMLVILLEYAALMFFIIWERRRPFTMAAKNKAITVF